MMPVWAPLGSSVSSWRSVWRDGHAEREVGGFRLAAVAFSRCPGRSWRGCGKAAQGGLSLQSVVVFVLQRQELQELLKTRCSREKAAGLAHVLQTPQATGRALDAH